MAVPPSLVLPVVPAITRNGVVRGGGGASLSGVALDAGGFNLNNVGTFTSGGNMTATSGVTANTATLATPWSASSEVTVQNKYSACITTGTAILSVETAQTAIQVPLSGVSWDFSPSSSMTSTTESSIVIPSSGNYRVHGGFRCSAASTEYVGVLLHFVNGAASGVLSKNHKVLAGPNHAPDAVYVGYLPAGLAVDMYVIINDTGSVGIGSFSNPFLGGFLQVEYIGEVV